ISALAPDIPVPEVKMRIAKPLPGGYYAILTTFMDGTPMNTVEVSADADTRASLYEAVGDIAARIHGLSLPANGLFSRNFMLSPRYDNLATWTGIYLGECFRNSVFRRRLGEQRLFELESVLFRYSEYFRPGQDRQMCHGDFNQKNILVSRNSTGRWQVSALLDWEFCSAGSGLLDIGNLFRFETDVHSDTARAFSNAYRDAGGQLEWDWLDRAHFYDLLSLCGFLCDSRDRPTTISTALGQVDARLVRYAA
ncbi:MAG: phosphotransferase, partial [Alphaproteobacteria bacterium]|nr:phosphotransferase [Alphaproteobacteria bacterium]